jgi:glycogen operon protein
MTDEAWNAPFVRSLGVLMVGSALDEVDERGRRVIGDTLLILLNGHHGAIPFVLPAVDGKPWTRVLDTIEPRVTACRYDGGDTYTLQGRTLALFTLEDSDYRRRASDSLEMM